MKLNNSLYFLLFFLISHLFSCGKKKIYSDVNLNISHYDYSNYNINFSIEGRGDSYISYWSLDSDIKFNSSISLSPMLWLG